MLMSVHAGFKKYRVQNYDYSRVVGLAFFPTLFRYYEAHSYVLVSPYAMIAMWRSWFRLSSYVYGGNRSFAPILRQSRWSRLYDVY
jgi:hypothetical protein